MHLPTRGHARFFTASFLVLLVSVSVPGQTEKLGDIKYTPPKGWTKSAKDHAVVFSDINPAEGKFGFITLYAGSVSSGTPQKDFAREWYERVVKPWKGEANPKTETDVSDGWTVTAGGAQIDFNGNKSVAFLTVVSGFGKSVSVLGVLNDEAYMTKLVAFSSSLEIEKQTIVVTPVPPIAAPLPPAQAAASASMHVASLVKEFETNEVRANQVWIGKRVRVHGTVNSIEIGKDGNIILTFKSSISTYNMGRAFFNKSQSSRVSVLNSHEQATIECTVKGLGGGFDNSKAFLLLESCSVP